MEAFARARPPSGRRCRVTLSVEWPRCRRARSTACCFRARLANVCGAVKRSLLLRRPDPWNRPQPSPGRGGVEGQTEGVRNPVPSRPGKTRPWRCSRDLALLAHWSASAFDHVGDRSTSTRRSRFFGCTDACRPCVAPRTRRPPPRDRRRTNECELLAACLLAQRGKRPVGLVLEVAEEEREKLPPHS